MTHRHADKCDVRQTNDCIVLKAVNGAKYVRCQSSHQGITSVADNDPALTLAWHVYTYTYSHHQYMLIVRLQVVEDVLALNGIARHLKLGGWPMVLCDWTTPSCISRWTTMATLSLQHPTVSCWAWHWCASKQRCIASAQVCSFTQLHPCF